MFAVGAIYLIIIAIYFAVISVQEYRVGKVETFVNNLVRPIPTPCNCESAIRCSRREELKFAALDCWKVTAELLPESATLDGFAFSEGRKLRSTHCARRVGQ